MSSMRLITVIGLILIPIFVASIFGRFTQTLSPQLQQDLLTVLQEQGVDKAKVSLDHLDAVLSGYVKSLDARQAARERIQNLHGIRVPAENNHIWAYPRLELNRSFKKIKVNGWLSPSDTATLDDWSVERKLDIDQLITDPWVVKFDRDNRPFLKQLLSEFFALPDARGMEISHERIVLTGDVTIPLLNKWRKASKGWFDPNTDNSRFRVFPSLFHFPSYKIKTISRSAGAKKLAKTLRYNPVYFASGSTDIAPVEIPKIEYLAKTIQSAGKKARFIIGGHLDGPGSLKRSLVLAKKRAENVVNQLVEFGVNKKRFTIYSFGPARQHMKKLSAKKLRHYRRVEILIK